MRWSFVLWNKHLYFAGALHRRRSFEQIYPSKPRRKRTPGKLLLFIANPDSGVNGMIWYSQKKTYTVLLARARRSQTFLAWSVLILWWRWLHCYLTSLETFPTQAPEVWDPYQLLLDGQAVSCFSCIFSASSVFFPVLKRPGRIMFSASLASLPVPLESLCHGPSWFCFALWI